MYSSSGFPPNVSSGWPLVTFRPVAVPAPTVLNVAAETLVTCRATAGSATADAALACTGDWGFEAINPAARTVFAFGDGGALLQITPPRRFWH